MTVLLGGPIEFPWYFYVVAALVIVGVAAVLILPITIPLAMANRREGQSTAKLAATYTLVGALPAAVLGTVVGNGRLALLLVLYVVAWIVAWSSSTSTGLRRHTS